MVEKNEFKIRTQLLTEIEGGVDLHQPDLFEKINHNLHRVDRRYQANQLKKEIIDKLVFKRQLLIDKCETEDLVIKPRFSNESEIIEYYHVNPDEPMPDITDLVEEISDIEEIASHFK